MCTYPIAHVRSCIFCPAKPQKYFSIAKTKRFEKNDLQLNSFLTEFMPWEVVNFKG